MWCHFSTSLSWQHVTVMAARHCHGSTSGVSSAGLVGESDLLDLLLGSCCRELGTVQPGADGIGGLRPVEHDDYGSGEQQRRVANHGLGIGGHQISYPWSMLGTYLSYPWSMRVDSYHIHGRCWVDSYHIHGRCWVALGPKLVLLVESGSCYHL